MNKVILCSSTDPEHLLDFIIGKNDNFDYHYTKDKKKQFWISTGLYPQNFVIQLGQADRELQGIRLKSKNIQSITITYTNNDNLDEEFTSLFSHNIDQTELDDDQITTLACDIPIQAKYIKFTIDAGYKPFCAIYNIVFDHI